MKVTVSSIVWLEKLQKDSTAKDETGARGSCRRASSFSLHETQDLSFAQRARVQASARPTLTRFEDRRDGPGSPAEPVRILSQRNAEDGWDRRPVPEQTSTSFPIVPGLLALLADAERLAMDNMTWLITTRPTTSRRLTKLAANETLASPLTRPWRLFDIGSFPFVFRLK